jgi:hypothetical protein
MSEKVADDDIDRDKLERPSELDTDADRDDDHEGRLRKRSKGYDGTGAAETPSIEEAEDEEKDRG